MIKYYCMNLFAVLLAAHVSNGCKHANKNTTGEIEMRIVIIGLGKIERTVLDNLPNKD